MKFEDVLRNSTRIEPDEAVVRRWRRAAFAPEAAVPGWVPSLASAGAMAAMLILLWPAAARGPVALRAEGVACDGRWEQSVPLKASMRDLAQPVPSTSTFKASEDCHLCHLQASAK